MLISALIFHEPGSIFIGFRKFLEFLSPGHKRVGYKYPHTTPWLMYVHHIKKVIESNVAFTLSPKLTQLT